MKIKSNNKGISLLSLIITIIVIIILAAIVIFSGMGTPERAQLSKVISDIDSVQTAIDQAYYGLYTEKAVAGEVWTESQLYEAVAKGITNRDELSGETGIIQIGKNSLANINLPEYEGKIWGVALENIDETTKTGNVVLAPGIESNGRIYSTLLDAQNGGRDTEISEVIKTNIETSNLKITTDFKGKNVAGTGLTKGTTLYINFEASEAGQSVEVSPSLPLAITTNGVYKFSLASTSGSAKTYQVTVNNYKVSMLASKLEVGDYVYYKPDAAEYTTSGERTGYTPQKLVTNTSAAWRVLYIDNATDEILITAEGGVNGGTYLSGAKGYFRGPDELDTICAKLYSNEILGVTARSMTIEDLNKACGYTVSTENVVRYAYYPNETPIDEEDKYIEYPENSGIKYEKKAHESAFARFYDYDGGGVESGDSDGFKYSEPTVDKPVFVTKTYYSYNPADYNSTVSSMLGSNTGWLASRCTYLSSYVTFDMRGVKATKIGSGILMNSKGQETSSRYYNIRPVVSLDTTFKLDTTDTSRNGKSSDKAWLILK